MQTIRISRVAVLCAALAASLSAAYAGDTADVCLRHVASRQAFAVSALLLQGSELNTALKTSSFETQSDYAVVLQENQASFIRLAAPLHTAGFSPVAGTDAAGAPWSVERGTKFCF